MSLKDRTNSVWENEILPHYNSLAENKKTEVCIIGAGITGISLAYQLARREKKVVVLDAFRIGSGQTGRTTAHLSTQLEMPIQHLMKHHDQEDINLLADAHEKAINEIETVIQENKIECDFVRIPGYYFAGEKHSVEWLNHEKSAGLQCGIYLDWIEHTPILTTNTPSLRYNNQAQFNPIKYLNGLIHEIEKRGGEIYENTHVTSIENSSEEIKRIITGNGFKIDAPVVVIATNTPINNRFYIHTKQYAYRSYTIGFKTKDHIKENCLLWDSEDPYHYARYVGDTLVVGGSDHRTGQSPESDPFKNLEEWSRKHFSFIKEISWKWSGQVFEPADHMAFIGENPRDKNVFICTGFSGMGMTNATIASILIPDLIEKKTHPWEKIFRPSRLMIHGLGDYIKENMNVAYQYTDWIKSSGTKTADEVERDKGEVVQEGFHKLCIYHSPDDHFQKKSAVCTHLGGVVHWNDVEKTWDCPCHGSRFNTNGEVIEGPAIEGLEG